MRFYKFLCLLVSLSVLLVPLLSLKKGEPTKNEASEQISEKEQAVTEGKNDSVKVFMQNENEVLQLDISEYLVGVLAAEMPATYHEEALKAQAVAAYTYLLRKRHEQQKAPDEALKGADLSNNSATHQGYITKAEREKKWGDKAESYEKKLKKAVEAVEGKVITYEGEPIIAAFHAINSGETQSAETVWGGEVAYLKGVPSPGDKLSPDCIKTVAITAKEFSDSVSQLKNCELNGEAQNWIGEIKTNSSGYVKSVEIGGTAFTGLQARDAIGLRSAVFTVEYKNGSFYFTTNGYGHCVGLSQYGADYMARQGSNWQEIIEHYYTGVTVK